MPIASRIGMTQARLAFGLHGEDLACKELERRGYSIVARRYRTKHGEIDIIARDARCLVFIEVKARQDRNFGDPEESVTLRKQQQMVWMATDYLTRYVPGEVACRFDVVAINTQTTPPELTLIQDAFRPGW
jgi:putative endonuclease